MTAERRSFYTTWAILWAVFGTLLSAALSSRPDGIARFFDLESWFAMFPVAWTGAILITRYREPLRLFEQSPWGRRLGALALFGSQGYASWQRGDALGRFTGCAAGVMAALVVISSCCEIVKSLRARLARP